MTTSSPSPKQPDLPPRPPTWPDASTPARVRFRRGPGLWAAGSALVLAVIATLTGTTPAAAAATVPLPVAAVLTGAEQTSVVVDLSSSTRPGPRSASVTTGGVQRPATLTPLMSAGLAVTIVVDTSTADAATLPAWLSAGARFILEAPTGTQATVLGTSAPAAAIAPPQQGPTGIVAALNGVRAHGDRDTATALTLAAQQFPAVAAGRKVAVVYTGAADAGGPSAAALAARFQAAGVILVVATTADASPYWTTAAEATGGFFAPAGHPVVVPALDQVETTLGSRYLVQFPTPAHRPATVSVQVKTPDLSLAAPVQLPAPATRPPSGHSGTLLTALAAAVIAVLALAGGLLFYRTRQRRRRPPPIVIAHGRAAVPTTPPPPEP